MHIVKNSSGQNEKTSPEELLKYGFVHEEIKDEVDSLIETATESNSPLSFTEITAFNTWFAMHPEKIAGKELLTTSREFPITIKGTKEDIINCISKDRSHTDNEKRIRIAKAKALAKLKILRLLQL